VGIIGTGASAIQCVPHVAEAAQHLYVFQRTPSSVDVRGNRPTDPEWAATLHPGWQQERISNFNVLVGGGHQEVDLVSDGWTDIIRRLAAVLPREADADVAPEEQARMAEMADFEKMESIRARVDAIVQDRETAEALKPYYRQFCKRPTFNDGYLPTFNRSNVTLVNTDGKGVATLTENSVVVDGTAYEVDCLIFASGFEVGTNYCRRAGFDTVGRDGQKLSEKWAEGPKTFHGLQSYGFPNAFFMGFTQTGITPNNTHMLSEQARHIAYVLAESNRRSARVVEASEAAEAAWQGEMERMAMATQDFFEACTPGYYNNEGRLSESGGLFSSVYGGGSEAFFGILRDWREAGGMEGVELS
jgi:cyclohexanone monooxygenase